jgi:competence ComEA-like helix-hairpin-helix protein
MAKQSIEPKRNTSRLKPGLLSQEQAVDAPRFSRHELAKLGALLTIGLTSLVLSMSAHGSMSAGVDQNGGGATEKVDWSVFLPEGNGKAEVALACTSCHDLTQVITQKKSAGNWRTTLQKMISQYQAPVDKEDMPILIEYLAKNFGDKNPIEQLPMNINTSSAEAIARVPGLTPELAKAVVESREAKGPFASVEDLKRVKGIGDTELKKIKSYLKTTE